MKRILFIVSMVLAVQVYAQDIRAVKVTDLEKIIKESRKPLLINFWASWCKPCLEEIPYFQKLVAEHKADSVELILVSVDYKEEFPKGIQATMKKRDISSRVVWLNESNADYFCPKIDKSWSGAVPSTLFINNRTGYRKFREEQVPEKELGTILQELVHQ